MNDVPILLKMFIRRPVSDVRPSSVTDNFRGRYHTISDFDCGIGSSFTQHLIIMNFHYIDKNKIISYVSVVN